MAFVALVKAALEGAKISESIENSAGPIQFPQPSGPLVRWKEGLAPEEFCIILA